MQCTCWNVSTIWGHSEQIKVIAGQIKQRYWEELLVPSAMALKAVLILVSPLTNNIQIKEKQPGSSISAIFYNTFYVRQPLGLCILKTRIVAPLVGRMATTGGTAHVETRRSRIVSSPSPTIRSTRRTWRSASSSVMWELKSSLDIFLKMRFWNYTKIHFTNKTFHQQLLIYPKVLVDSTYKIHTITLKVFISALCFLWCLWLVHICYSRWKHWIIYALVFIYLGTGFHKYFSVATK